jgi:ribosomal protein S18 acetylase RimI-like enzyme
MGCPLWRWVQYGGLDIRRRMGPTAYRELTRVSDRIDHMRDRVAPQRYLYLSSLGVVPEHRREGLARALVLPRLQQAADEGLSTVVETNSEGALAFYQSVGFTVLAQFNISGLQYSVLEHRADPSAVRK